MFNLSSDPAAASQPVSTKSSISPGDRLTATDGVQSLRRGHIRPTWPPQTTASATNRARTEAQTPRSYRRLTANKLLKIGNEPLRVRWGTGGKRLNTNPVWRPSWSSAEQRQGWLTSGEREEGGGRARDGGRYRRERGEGGESERSCAVWPLINEL